MVAVMTMMIVVVVVVMVVMAPVMVSVVTVMRLRDWRREPNAVKAGHSRRPRIGGASEQ